MMGSETDCTNTERVAEQVVHSNSLNTPKSITTCTNHSSQCAVTLQLSHQLFVTSAESGDRRKEWEREKMVYWNLVPLAE